MGSENHKINFCLPNLLKIYHFIASKLTDLSHIHQNTYSKRKPYSRRYSRPYSRRYSRRFKGECKMVPTSVSSTYPGQSDCPASVVCDSFEFCSNRIFFSYCKCILGGNLVFFQGLPDMWLLCRNICSMLITKDIGSQKFQKGNNKFNRLILLSGEIPLKHV